MTNFNDIIDEMSKSNSDAHGEITSLIRDFESQMIDAIERLSYEFIDAPDEILAPDDDPNFDIAMEIQGRYFQKMIRENLIDG